MKIESKLMTEGLFGQIFVWLLELLPYLDSNGLKPEWCVRTKNYGEPPDDNIFPGIIRTRYTPSPDGRGTESLEALKWKHMHFYKHDFRLANQLWNSYFSFPEDVIAALEEYCLKNFSGETVLGVHYRGTDKNADGEQTNPVGVVEFIWVVREFLAVHKDITAVFVATDDLRFLRAISKLKKVLFIPQPRSEDDRPVWNRHPSGANQGIAKYAILDCLALSRCDYVLKCMSALSAFSKVINPDLKTFRISACKVDWFPESYVPLYSSSNPFTRQLLQKLQQGDVSASRAPAFSEPILPPLAPHPALIPAGLCQ